MNSGITHDGAYGNTSQGIGRRKGIVNTERQPFAGVKIAKCSLHISISLKACILNVPYFVGKVAILDISIFFIGKLYRKIL